MSRRSSRIRTLLLIAALVLLCAPAFGDDAKVKRWAERLEKAQDFRVRTQAALALGASKSKNAVSPLCRGLYDSSATVRSASAAALGKLKRGGQSCLEKRLASEKTASVKSSIKKALAKLAPAEPSITSSTRYYLAIGKIIDKSGRKGNGVAALVRGAMSKTAGGMDGYVVAPADETEAAAKKRMAKHKQVRGFLLSPRVTQPKYTDGNLSVKIEVAIFTYPGKSLKGTIPIKLTQQDVSERDTDNEDDLLRMAAERAVEKFAENVERIQ